MYRTYKVLLSLLFFPCLGWVPSGAAQTNASPTQVGVAAAATLVATGTPPRQAQRILEVGTDLVQNERIETSDTGRVHLLFRDGSTLTIGPNSDLVLDAYLYDPKAKAGKVAFSTVKGVFRFIGGRISKSSPVEFRTPVATLGIRGGINQFVVDDSRNNVRTAHIFGDATTITVPLPDGRTDVTTIARQEFQAQISSLGPVSIGRMTAQQFADMNIMFERPPGVFALGLPAGGGDGGANAPVPPLSPDTSPAVNDAQFNIPGTMQPFDNSILQRALPVIPPLPTVPTCKGDFCN